MWGCVSAHCRTGESVLLWQDDKTLLMAQNWGVWGLSAWTRFYQFWLGNEFTPAGQIGPRPWLESQSANSIWKCCIRFWLIYICTTVRASKVSEYIFTKRDTRWRFIAISNWMSSFHPLSTNCPAAVHLRHHFHRISVQLSLFVRGELMVGNCWKCWSTCHQLCHSHCTLINTFKSVQNAKSDAHPL